MNIKKTKITTAEAMWTLTGAIKTLKLFKVSLTLRQVSIQMETAARKSQED